MLKRTKIYLVLTLLVLTGFGGSLNTNSLSSKERSTLVTELKDSKKAFIQSVKGLSPKQLNYKPSGKAWSIKELTHQLLSSENQLWQMAGQAFHQQADTRNRNSIKVSDDQLKQLHGSVQSYLQTTSFDKNRNMDDMVHDFKNHRAYLLRFAKTTTDDLRNQVKKLPFGTVDSYQLLMLVAFQTKYATRQIEQIKNSPDFPR